MFDYAVSIIYNSLPLHYANISSGEGKSFGGSDR